MTATDIISLSIAGAAAVAAIIAAVIFNNQLEVMKGQLDEMKRSGDDTRRAADAAKESADAARDAVRLGENTAERQLRAYIGFEAPGLFMDSPQPGKVTAWIRLKNSGVTPAYKVKAWMTFKRDIAGQAPWQQMVGTFANEATILPGGTFNLNSTQDIDSASVQRVANGLEAFFVRGHCEYVDAFDKPRHFSFRGEMTGPLETIVIDGQKAKGWGFNPVAGGIDSN
jgi:hypothetical protein